MFSLLPVFYVKEYSKVLQKLTQNFYKMSEDAIRRPQYAFSNQFFQITFSSKTQDAITNSILCVWGKSFFKICIWSSLHHWRHHNSWKKEGCIILRFVVVLAGARLNSHMKEAILAQGYIRRTTMSSVDMPIYIKRRLWRHMTKSRMSNFARAIRPWQSVCSFVTRLLMLRQGTTLSRPAAKPQKKLVFRLETLAAQATKNPLWENI